MLVARTGSGQILPSGPLVTAGGRLVVSGQAAVSVASDDPAYFDYSSYDDNLMQLVRFDAAGNLTVSSHLSLLGDVRVEGSTGGGQWRFRPYALFARIRPWSDRSVDVQVGLIPPVFGLFSRRAYASDNPLIGFPLAYQYLTSLRTDAVPVSADDLLRMRGRGWLTSYPLDYGQAASGVPIVDGLRYQSGAEVHVGDGRPVEAAAALTSGSLSSPTSEYGRALRQVSGRIAVSPFMGLVLGLSVSRGPFLARSVADEYSTASGDQRAIGFDAEFSRGHWLVRAEGIGTSWDVPRIAAPFIDGPLSAFAMYVEGRYRILPGLYAAARVDRLDFSEVSGSTGSLPWDAPVRRVEIGAGYSVIRNVLLKVAWQRNWRDSIPPEATSLVSAQVQAWF